MALYCLNHGKGLAPTAIGAANLDTVPALTEP
jgi:hypothetical protein